MFEAAPLRAPPATAAKPSKGTILVVDDELTLVRVYARALGAEGYRVLTATDGETAQTMFRRTDLDTVISDVSMPGMDGLSLLRSLRRIDPDVPVILATGDHWDERAQEAVAQGALMYLIKPIDLRALSQIVSHATQRRRLSALLREAKAGAGQGGEADAPDDGRLTAHLDAALATLWIAYQPIVCWATLAILGYEALVRSDEPALAEPGVLFAAADRLKRTPELGRAIRARIAGDLPAVPAEARVFVNLHPEELADDALYSTHEPLRAHAARIVLEVTERDSLARVPHLAERMDSLRAAGFAIAVDDLGAGYAGLSSLVLLKPDVVKIDASLVRGIDRTPLKRRIVQAMASLCRDIGVEVVAEGVETEDERQTLGFLGCRYQQGFAYAHPEKRFTPPRPELTEEPVG